MSVLFGSEKNLPAANCIFCQFLVPIGIPQRVYAEPFNESSLTVYWNPVPDSRLYMKGRLKGYKVSI